MGQTAGLENCMDAIVVTNRIRPAADIFRKLEDDPEAAIRDTVHVLGDLLLDHAFDRIRGGPRPTTDQESLPPPAAPAPAPPELAVCNPDAEALRARIAELEAVTRGLQDTIAGMRRPSDRVVAPSEKRPRGRELDRGQAMEKALDHEDSLPAEDLMNVTQIALKLGCSTEMVRLHAKKPDFPKLAARLGPRRVFHWRRVEIETWMSARERRHRPSANEKSCATCADGPVVGRILMCRSEGGPFRNKSRAPQDTCDYHRKPTPAYRPVRPDLEEP
jgi:predicted DNA-binding transcriptional regulator AlpA